MATNEMGAYKSHKWSRRYTLPRILQVHAILYVTMMASRKSVPSRCRPFTTNPDPCIQCASAKWDPQC
jgi:hypothetical protein